MLGAPNYTYAEATATQRGPDWIASHERALEYYGGATTAIVCDQLKSGVSRACRYEPEPQRTYEELAEALRYGEAHCHSNSDGSCHWATRTLMGPVDVSWLIRERVWLGGFPAEPLT